MLTDVDWTTYFIINQRFKCHLLNLVAQSTNMSMSLFPDVLL